ncbi:MAG: hypothetical protein ABI970_25710 [Chloroflexota bacterium]
MMMDNSVPLIQTSELFFQASNLMISTLPLQQQIQGCHDELTLLISLEAATQDELARLSDLKDEIWGCRIEVQSLRLKAKRLLKKARYICFGDVEKPIESASHC